MLTEKERSFLDAIAKAPFPTDVPGLRDALEKFGPMMNANPPAIGGFHEKVEIHPGLHADVAVPYGNGPHPTLVYLHGGGWVAGSPGTHRKLAMQFAEAGFLVINVDYRLAPEHPFPNGLDDCIYAVKWAGLNARRWKGDGNRLAIGGDSAGGNLTAATLVSLAEERFSGPKPKAALLIYGVFDFPATLKRAKDRTGIEGMVRAYAGKGYPTILDDSRLSPIKAVKAGGLPPCFVVCGTEDELLPESQNMAAALKSADIRRELEIYPDVPHGFVQMDELSAAADARGKMFKFLRSTL
jgi:acetyl esterase